MNYALAKKLKEAGFPFQHHRPDEHGTDRWMDGLEDDTTYFAVPTLSELIEACGNNLRALQRHYDYDEDGFVGWDAVQEWDTYYPPSVANGTIGDTPEEAVARLWLALNKKP